MMVTGCHSSSLDSTCEGILLETRFAQFFFVHSKRDANHTLEVGDPVVDVTETLGAPLPGPFAGQSINCRTCHLVDEQGGVVGGGNRTYADFAPRSPLPARDDGLTHTPRNSPPLVNAFFAEPRELLLHFDGEFATVKDLVASTFTGRNFGWLPREQQQAVTYIAHIIRDDDGSGELAQEFGGPYAVVLKGTDASIPPEFRLPVEFRIDVSTASDAEILDAIAMAARLQVPLYATSRALKRALWKNIQPWLETIKPQDFQQ